MRPAFLPFYTELTLHIYISLRYLFQLTGHCEMAKIKGFKNPDLDFVGIQVIQISFKQFCSSPAF